MAGASVHAVAVESGLRRTTSENAATAKPGRMRAIAASSHSGSGVGFVRTWTALGSGNLTLEGDAWVTVYPSARAPPGWTRVVTE